MENWQPLVWANQSNYNLPKEFRAESVPLSENTGAYEISDALWKSAPFLGELNLSDKAREAVLNNGRAVIRQLNDPYGESLIQDQKNMLVLSLIVAVQAFDSNEDDTQMWASLARQLDFEDDFMTTCNKLRPLIRDTIQRNDRFFTAGGQKYYNTLNIHALSPAWTIDHLYNILYSFYTKNLESQYFENDISFRLFVKNIAARWAEQKEENEQKLRLKSDSISSSFRQLFSEQPELMTAVCDRLVYKLDDVAKNGTKHLNSQSRWDELLKEWYEKKSDQEKKQMKETRRHAGKGKVVTNAAAISPVYETNGQDVFLVVPRIRLPEITNNTQLVVYQNDKQLFTKDLQTRGDDLCWTTAEYRLQLTSEEINIDQPFHFRLRLVCDGNHTVYDSEKKLYREFILFNHRGSELKSIKSDTEYFYLFTDTQCDPEIDDDPDNYYAADSFGCLMHICAGTAKSVLVNGIDILHADAKAAKTPIRCFFSQKSLENIRIIDGETEYRIFDRTVRLKIMTEDDLLPKKYYVLSDGKEIKLPSSRGSDGCYTVMTPTTPRVPHNVRVMTVGGRLLFSASYYVFLDLSYGFDQPYYRNIEHCRCRVDFKQGGMKFSETFRLDEDQRQVEFNLWDTYHCIMDVPRLNISLGDRNAFTLPEKMWHKDIPTSDYISVSRPNGIQTVFMLSGRKIEGNTAGTSYDIGNFLHSTANWGFDMMPFGVFVYRGDQKLEEILLADICTKERFTASPLSVDESHLFQWNPEGIFLGDADAKLRVEIASKNGTRTFDLTAVPETLSETEEADGYYDYKVTLVPKGMFGGKPREIYKDRLTIGDPAEFEMIGRRIELKRAKYWDLSLAEYRTSSLRAGEAVLQDIHFAGYSKPDDSFTETKTEYEATLVRIDKEGAETPYTAEDSENISAINPVHFWLVNKKQMVVRRPSGEDIWLNTQTSNIMSSIRIIGNESDYIESGEFFSLPIYFIYSIQEQEN